MRRWKAPERWKKVKYNNFKDDLLAEVKARLLSEQGYEVDYSGESRNHSEYLKIFYRNADLVELPVKVFVNQYEERSDLARIADQIQETVCLVNGYPEPEQPKFSYADYDTIKENLAVRLEPATKEEEASGSVYEKNALGILSVYYRVPNRENTGWQWTRVPLYMQQFYGVSKEEIIAKGLENTSGFSLLRIYPVTAKGKESMSLITTFDRSYGATAFLYPGVQEELRKQMRGEYYVLPLNVNEILTIKKRSPVKEEQLRKFQQRILQNTLGKDYLSGDLFVYDTKEKRLTVCENKTGHGREPLRGIR